MDRATVEARVEAIVNEAMSAGIDHQHRARDFTEQLMHLIDTSWITDALLERVRQNVHVIVTDIQARKADPASYPGEVERLAARADVQYGLYESTPVAAAEPPSMVPVSEALRTDEEAAP